VSRKTREISIRIALGALTKDVIWMVMREVLLLIGIGVVIGMGGALLLTRYIEGQLFGFTPNDPLTLCGGCDSGSSRCHRGIIRSRKARLAG
jgi:ABC-type antimicrobial peptide transport system permease subunit